MLTICHPGDLEEYLAASAPEEGEAKAKKHVSSQRNLISSSGMDQVVLSKTDAWVFMAIGPVWRERLADVVFSLDYLNRTMPSGAEFEASVRRLGAAGFITVSSKGFKQTRVGRRVMKQFGLREGVIAIMVELMDQWDGLAVAAVDANFEFKLKPGEWQRAQDDYEARLTRRMAKFAR